MFEASAIDVLRSSQSIQPGALLLVFDRSTAQVFMQRAVTQGLERGSVDQAPHFGIDEKSVGKGQD